MMKKKNDALLDDPVVAEVRAIRAKLWKEAGGSIQGLLRLLDERFSHLADARKKRSTRRQAKAKMQ